MKNEYLFVIGVLVTGYLLYRRYGLTSAATSATTDKFAPGDK
jgi:hypothetical protein